MEPKKIFAIIFALAIVAIVVGVIVTNSYVQKEPDGYYNYEIEYQDSFTSSAGVLVKPSEGRTFAIVDVVVENRNFGDGISTTPVVLVWKLTLDRVTYNLNSAFTLLHPDYWDVTIEKGKTWGYTVVFEIPKESVGKLDANISYSYTTINNAPSLRYDENLVLPNPEFLATS